MDNKTALLLVDIQNDFFPSGALGVPGANAIFPVANQIQDYFDIVIASKDWHPKNHISFISEHPKHQVLDTIYIAGVPQVIWPVHCVQETKGADFYPSLRLDKLKKIIYKGTDPTIDGYSAFFDNAHHKSTGLEHYLKEEGISCLYIMGLATDYCVLYSVQDALKLGFKTTVIQDGCYGIDQKPGDVKEAFRQMQEGGALIVHSHTIMDAHSKRSP